MNTELQQIFANVPEDRPRSRLEPYREQILRWRRQGRSYRRIRQLIAGHFNVVVTTSTLHKFVQRRSRPRKEEPETEVIPTTFAPKPADPKVDQWAEARCRMEQAKNEPLPVPKPKLFDYPESDSIEPLVMLSKKPKEN